MGGQDTAQGSPSCTVTRAGPSTPTFMAPQECHSACEGHQMIPKDSGDFLTEWVGEENAIRRHPRSDRALLNSQFGWDVYSDIRPVCTGLCGGDTGQVRSGMSSPPHFTSLNGHHDVSVECFCSIFWNLLSLCSILIKTPHLSNPAHLTNKTKNSEYSCQLYKSFWPVVKMLAEPCLSPQAPPDPPHSRGEMDSDRISFIPIHNYYSYGDTQLLILSCQAKRQTNKNAQIKATST